MGTQNGSWASTICLVDSDTPKKTSLGPLVLIAMNASVIVGLEGLPDMALYGVPLISLFLIGAIAFLIPVGLVSSELAVGWPGGGGVYGWVDAAFGRRTAVIAVWCQWMQVLVWYPTALSFGAATVAYIFNPSLAENKLFNIAVVLVIFWTVTLVNLRGIKTSSIIAVIGLVLGTILPVLLVIIFALVWLAGDHEIAIPPENRGFFPKLDGIRGLVLAAGMVTFYSGLEVNAVHGARVRKPRASIPFAMVCAAGLVLAIYVFGSLGIAFMLTPEEIQASLNVGPMEMFQMFLEKHGLGSVAPILAACVALGVLGHVSTWVIGPTEAVSLAARRRDLPEVLGHTNRSGAPSLLLFIQAGVVTGLAFVFLLLKNPSVAFFALTILSGAIYLVMYIIMFAAGIRLRYSHPHVERHFKIPGGKLGMWGVAGLGIAVSLLALGLSFLPPEKSQLDIGNTTTYLFVIGGVFLVLVTIGALIPLPPRSK
jgi:amino acid transporter